ncbi:hypothetical protein EZ456_04750 [Pedobacter psychrodurus]|uniref:Bacterial surface antigen (D15) domain-containing protein n=1 Tax=Pedobacter psychrodurus TaxID=2530456 RepID=A0A4R0Q148_9SPHI|nr:BamA/TamA family outer membrane protein [Pedobacter psychrodurus]TCD28696.1 hypothetical protein EZ456_04750 [Pedobacter psychrodurus]
MKQKILIPFVLVVISALNLSAQEREVYRDSVWISILPKYDSVSKIHRLIFGENYRKEYSLKAKLPILRLSEIWGGLKILQVGGGNQSKSLRLIDPKGNEWTMRSIEKYPEVLLPKGLQETFLRDIIKDNMSAQHPFSALIVPTLAREINVAHSEPTIGVVLADKNLGKYAADFENTIALLEKRDPWGKSDNTAKMHRKLTEDNDNSVDAEALLKLKCLDVLIGDWDRHDDQWRWLPVNKDKGYKYIPIPRDRDQVFFSSEGKIQRILQSSWSLPMMQGFERGIRNINWFLWEGREINSRWFNEMDFPKWDEVVRNFCSKMSDSVLSQALKKLPEPGYSLRQKKLLAELQSRRSRLPELMAEYYRFFNKIIDVELTDKNEFVNIRDTTNGKTALFIRKIGGSGATELIFSRLLDPEITKELRIYLHKGNDKVVINSGNLRIKIRIIGGYGEKSYAVNQSSRNIRLYDIEGRKILGSDAEKVILKLNSDSSNLSYHPKEIYARHYVSPNFGFNNDDGIGLGLTAKFTAPGFRKKPYHNIQTVSLLYSAATGAFRVAYRGEWFNVLGSAAITVGLKMHGPSNAQNFFGSGNQTPYDRNMPITYYRARFDFYEFNPGLKWSDKSYEVSMGLVMQHYRYQEKENQGRLISYPELRHSSDSLELETGKTYGGLNFSYQYHTKDGLVLPSKGIHLDVKMNAYKGLNSQSKSLMQITSSFSIYKTIDNKGILVISNRIGGGTTFGKPAFFQSQFLGGQNNLSGYRFYRFAGEHSIYNNIEIRLRLGSLTKHIFAGEVGLSGLYDVGRVWLRNEKSDTLHHGFGGGIYISPAAMAVIRLNANFSREGFFPVFSMAWRY